MSDIDELVRETFGGEARGMEVPPFDELAFRRHVSAARRRRRVRVGAGVAVAASVAAIVAYAVPAVLDATDGGGTPQVAVAPVQVDTSALPEPLYYTAGGRLMAVTPDGAVHDLGLRSEGIVGFTAEGVLAIGPESDPVWIGASSSGEGDGSYTFERDSGPTAAALPATGPVQSVALSGDGRYLAWITLDDAVEVYDLKAEQLVDSTKVGPNSYVSSVSERGALVSENGDLELVGQDGVVHVPTEGDGYGWVSDTAGDYVSVVDRDDVTRLYDVTRTSAGDTPTARLVDSVPGTGRLAPYAAGMVSVDGPRVRMYPADGDPAVLAVGGIPQTAGWLDEEHAVVASAESGGTSVYVCPVADLTCTRVAYSKDDVRLAE